MALTPTGFSGGSMTDTSFGQIAQPTMFVEYAVSANPPLLVSQPSQSSRTIQINPGAAVAYGVRVVNDSAISLGLTAPGTGIQWQMIVLRRDRAAKSATIVALNGPTTSVAGITPVGLPSGFLAGAGSTQFDQPLAWVWVQSGSASLGIFDLRIYGAGASLWASSLPGIALAPYIYPVGTYLSSGPTDGGLLGGNGGWTVVTGTAILAAGQLRATKAELDQIALYVNQVNGHPLIFDGGGPFPAPNALAYDVPSGWTYYWRQDAKAWRPWVADMTSQVGYAGTVSANAVKLYRNGNTTTLQYNLNVGGNGANNGSANLMLNVPTTCTPPFSSDHWASNGTNGGTMMMALDTDGGLRIRYGSVGANGGLYGTATWVNS